jgi:hypothetical protein
MKEVITLCGALNVRLCEELTVLTVSFKAQMASGQL